MEQVKPTSTMNYSREALLRMGNGRAEVRGIGDITDLRCSMREGVAIHVVGGRSEGSLHPSMGSPEANSKGGRARGQVHVREGECAVDVSPRCGP